MKGDDSSLDTDELASQLRSMVERSMASHRPWIDSVLFNGGTILALAATIAATAISWSGDEKWIPRLCTGIAALLIAMERALNFGERWRYHRGMRAAYGSQLSRLALASYGSEAERAKKLDDITVSLEQLALREADIPGVTAPTQGP